MWVKPLGLTAPLKDKNKRLQRLFSIAKFDVHPQTTRKDLTTFTVYSVDNLNLP